jgi:ABC-type multidrug transport system fused ATPase/permease subunit
VTTCDTAPLVASERRDARRVLGASQGFFFASLILCVFVDHGLAARNDGISFYGVFHRTVVILITGFAAAAVGLWRTATYYASLAAPSLLIVGVRAVAVGLFLLLVTPYDAGPFLNWSHMTVGTVMALVQLALTTALVRRQRSVGSVVAWVVQLAAGVVAALSLPDWHFPNLLLGESFFEVGFGISLFVWITALSYPTARRARVIASV